MKIAKISVEPANFGKIDLGNNGNLKLNQGRLANLYKKVKDKSKKYLLVNYNDNQLVAADDALAKECFKVFDNDTQLKEHMGHSKNLWYYYEFDKIIADETKLRYESFFSGFLHYYDTEVRNGMSDHILWCHWVRTGNKKKKDIVKAYIYPAPLRHPLKNIKEISPETKTPKEYASIRKTENERLQNAISNWKSPGIDGEATDPASPSGPPPPYAPPQ